MMTAVYRCTCKVDIDGITSRLGGLVEVVVEGESRVMAEIKAGGRFTRDLIDLVIEMARCRCTEVVKAG